VPSPQQRAAADPGRSAWVSANAGSGKTSVLVDRVVRLMLAGAAPARILCLTYTKAAAANMQNRVFERLGGWAALTDAELAAALEALDGSQPRQQDLLAARRLFARALETPGGLKIQTIHAFCERLLHLFPFEAQAPGRFEMLDEAQAAAAMTRALAGTLRAALAAPDGELGEALRTATEAAAEEGVGDAVRRFIAHRRATGRSAPERKFAVTPLRAALGLQASDTAEGIRTGIVEQGLYAGDWRAIESWLRSSGKGRDAEMADFLKAGAGAQGARDADSYIRVFLSAKYEPRSDKGWFVSSDLRKKASASLQTMLDERDRVAKGHARLLAARAAERTEAIVLLADAALDRYEAEKRRLGRQDFEDLIRKSRDLLASDKSRWVLYKLDQGVDHILVDEAQDTSPAQWDIVKALADEFFVEEAPARTRTIFAVGDEKQSIFSFQGARPEAFDEARRHFGGRIEGTSADAERRLLPVPLLTSYRTTPDVLAFVDAVFRLPENHAGLTSGAEPTLHQPVRKGEPGLVELWPPEEREQEQDVDPMAPVDALPPNSPARKLASRIAGRIRHWLDNGVRLDAGSRKRIGAGDILILVRNRNAIFDETIKALKTFRIPAAGADRMKLGRQIAVRDLLSLGKFCALPDDDLSLAEVLKSPLVGLDDEQLERLAAGRGPARLIDRLDAAAAEGAPFAEAARRIADWRGLAAACDPLAFYGRVLAGGGRARLIGRLGPDAADAVDVFLYRLRRWQAANPASLPLFVEAMSGDETDVKRDMEDAHGRVRVMTIHASKGLEAPIVFLADTHHKPGGKGPGLLEIVPGDPDTAFWCPRTGDDPPAAAAARDRHASMEAAEHRRLLYVGLTRAKDRLYICGAAAKRDPEQWRGMIDAALDGQAHVATVAAEEGTGDVLQWRIQIATVAPPEDEAPSVVRPAAFPWLGAPASPEPARPPPLRPSRIAEAADRIPTRIPNGPRSAARLRGEFLHLLLQRLPALPADRRRAAAEALAAARGGGLTPEARDAAIADALRLMAHPRWSHLFEGDARTEAEIAGRIAIAGGPRDVSGRIDRLLIGPRKVTILDYKTGRPPEHAGDIPRSIVRQMAAYRALVGNLFPGKEVEAAILWTAIPEIAVLDGAVLDAALADLA
jgi:ATP-dependent helicase/nuclease subunit A